MKKPSQYEYETALGFRHRTVGQIIKAAIYEDCVHFWLVPFLLSACHVPTWLHYVVTVVIFALMHGTRAGFVETGDKWLYFKQAYFWRVKFPITLALGTIMWLITRYCGILIESAFHIVWNIIMITAYQKSLPPQNLGTWLNDMAEIYKYKKPHVETPEEKADSEAFWAELSQGCKGFIKTRNVK